MLATYINVIAVIVGSVIGLIFKRYISDRFKTIVFQATGMSTMVIGITMIVKTKKPVLVVFSIIIGGIIGELLKIEQRLERFGEWIKGKVKQKEQSTFTEGFVNSSLIFCVGAMTIIGAINASAGSYDVLLTKSMMDGCISIVLASILGTGVIFSCIPILLYQGGLTLIASNITFINSPIYLSEISGAGGILVLGIGFNLLEVKKIHIGNFIPAIFLSILFVALKIF